MRELLPEPREDADLTRLLDRSDRVPPPDRPWVMANMVMSADGAFSVHGRSAGLSGAADREVFHTLRAAADVILVAAGTAREERYRRPITAAGLHPLRERAGLEPVPRLVVVSRSMSFPPDQPFLEGDGPDPLVLHPSDATVPAHMRGVETVALGATSVDLPAALGLLRARGVEQVLCEGGPTLLGALQRTDLLDELFLTLSPVLVGGDRLGLLGDVAPQVAPLELHRVLESGGHLFLTYRTER